MWKASFDRYFASFVTYLRNAGGINECMRLCAEYAMQGGIPTGAFEALNDVHPRALLLLAKYGYEFQPFVWETPPPVEPKPGSCFGNADAFQRGCNRGARAKNELRYSYVEGVAFGGRTDPVLHAWNCIAGTTMAIDTTWYSVTGWTFYIGIPFAEGQYRMLRKLAHPANDHRPLFRPDCFPRIEEPLTRMLQKRQEQTALYYQQF
jgi:hypothetical protein